MSEQGGPPADDAQPDQPTAETPDPAEPPPDDATQLLGFQQELLPQVVQPRPRRTGLIIGLAVLVVIVAIGGVVAYIVGQGSGGGDRDAYCDALRKATNNGDISSAIEGTDPAVIDQVAKLAPDSVADDWRTLMKIRDTLESGEPETDDVLTALTAVTAIVDDAQSECDLTLDVPSL